MNGQAVGGDATVHSPAPAWVHTTRSMLVEHDLVRARLRARIYQLEEAIRDAGFVPPDDRGESMAVAYQQKRRAVTAVLDYFNVTDLGLEGLPPELHEAFRPLVIT